MPAELTYTDGTADFFEVGTERSAWHREGHLIPPDREITIPEALELIHGGYPVVRQPTFLPVNAAGDELRPSKYAYVTIRADTGEELGSVGRSYTVLQNHDAFRALEPLLDQGVVRLETGGVLRSGADIGCSAGSISTGSARSCAKCSRRRWYRTACSATITAGSALHVWR